MSLGKFHGTLNFLMKKITPKIFENLDQLAKRFFRINEDLQKLILYLICGLKRVVKYLNDNKTMGKYLRRVVKKHSPTEIDFAIINPAELSSVFCAAIKVSSGIC